LAPTKERCIVFDDLKHWIYRLSGNAQNTGIGGSGGTISPVHVRTDSLVKVFVERHHCEPDYDRLLAELRERHPALGEYVQMPEWKVPAGAVLI
jgi:hypothetical protein